MVSLASVAGERTVPLLPCRDVDEAFEFYRALGFERTYRQLRPNPYIAVRRDDLEIHLFGIDGFEPADSYGSVLVLTPDCDRLHAEFVEGLRSSIGRVPRSGIPRMLRPRTRDGGVRGFSVVDPGGNWLRFTRSADPSDEPAEATELVRVLQNATRLGDHKGDEAAALRLVSNGLERWPDAPPADRIQALLYRAQLELRLGRPSEASVTVRRATALSDAAGGVHAEEIVSLSEEIGEAS